MEEMLCKLPRRFIWEAVAPLQQKTLPLFDITRFMNKISSGNNQ